MRFGGIFQRQRVGDQHAEFSGFHELRALFEYPALADAFIMQFHHLRGEHLLVAQRQIAQARQLRVFQRQRGGEQGDDLAADTCRIE